MKIAFTVNDIQTEKAGYTTTLLAMAALARGHKVFYIDVAGFSFDPDDSIHAHAVQPLHSDYGSKESFIQEVQRQAGGRLRINVDTLDILMLRNDPAEDSTKRPWARLAPIYFGRQAARHGVIVLNDPDGLTHAINKSYLEYLPRSVRPLSIITRNERDIRSFGRAVGGSFVIKPLTGSGGRNVYFIRDYKTPELSSIIDKVLNEDYAIAQEYLPGASEGDVRLFTMNGVPLQDGGVYAAARRVPHKGIFVSNITAGGTVAPVEITDKILHVAAQVQSRLVADGIFFAGLDIVGDKLMEVNVYSPGALGAIGEINKKDFIGRVIDALEHKVAVTNSEPARFTNREIAVL